MYRTTRTSTICVTIAAATVAIILLTSATLTISVYAARHHHGNRSIEDGYQTYGLSGPPLSDQVNAPPVSDQANGNGNGNNPVGNQAAPPVSDQANGNGNGNNPVGNQAAPPVSDQANGKEQIQTHAPTITYKSTSSNDMLMHFANVTQPLCGAGICSQSSTNH
jgi:hypothetical protein